MDNMILYTDNRIRIEIWPEEEKGHFLYLDRSQYGLQRGILEELAKTAFDEIESKLNTVYRTIIEDARRKGISLGNISTAIAQARIAELERLTFEARQNPKTNSPQRLVDTNVRPVPLSKRR